MSKGERAITLTYSEMNSRDPHPFSALRDSSFPASLIYSTKGSMSKPLEGRNHIVGKQADEKTKPSSNEKVC